MVDLVPIPWQPTMFLTRSTLARLQDASRRLGRNIYVVAPDGAWRSYDRQEYLWDINGHNPAKANNPDVGQRSHMRGAAFDARETGSDTQRACRDAGLIRDPNEQWHWNDPNWAFMAIIRANAGTASSDSAPISTPSRRKKKSMATVYYQGTSNPGRYALAGDGVGDAAWIETMDTTLASEWVLAHQPDLNRAVTLSPASFDNFRQRYTSPAK